MITFKFTRKRDDRTSVGCTIMASKRFGSVFLSLPWLSYHDPKSMCPKTHGTLFSHMGVSKNSGTPKSSILIWFTIINHPFWGTTIFENTHIELLLSSLRGCSGWIDLGHFTHTVYSLLTYFSDEIKHQLLPSLYEVFPDDICLVAFFFNPSILAFVLSKKLKASSFWSLALPTSLVLSCRMVAFPSLGRPWHNDYAWRFWRPCFDRRLAITIIQTLGIRLTDLTDL